MSEHFVNRPLLDLSSFARRGPYRALTPTEVEHIRRTVRRAPEVMVKVLSQPAATGSQVGRHIDYVARDGELELEMDDGRQLSGDDVGTQLIEEWNLDVARAGSAEAVARGDGRTPRLVHKLVFSMPAGTPPQKVLAAVHGFAREEFGLRHRYAMALHTDEPHPHVHLIVKAVSEDGERLNIRKETLRVWRAGFAAQLRQSGVEANATERAVRGSAHQSRKIGIYRAAERGASTFLRAREQAFVTNPAAVRAADRVGRGALSQSRQDVVAGWLAVAEVAGQAGLADVAAGVRQFVARMPPVRTDQELIARQLAARNERARTME